MKKSIFIFLLISLLTGSIATIGKCQATQADLNRYWNYRMRLVNSFMTIGMGTASSSNFGESIPADVRNGGSNGGPSNILYHGDDGRTIGYYIGTLATEWKLLKNNHQSTDETVMELFYALHAIFRCDSEAIHIWNHLGLSYSNPAIVGADPVTFPGSGFMMPNDIGLINLPADAATPINNPQNLVTYKDVNNVVVALVGTGQVGPVTLIEGGDGAVVTAVSGDPFTSFYTSIDNYIGILIGLSLAVKELDPGITSFTAPNGNTCNFGSYYGDLQSMAEQLGHSILYYIMISSDFELKFPDGTLTPNDAGDASQFEKPLELIADDFFGFSNATSLTGPTPGFPLPDWSDYSLCSQLDLKCNPPQIQNIEMGCEMAAASNDGGYYSNAVSMISALGNYGSNPGCGILCQLLPANNYGWDLFYGAVLEVLHPGSNLVAPCDMTSIISGAPDGGPFCHVPGSDYAPNGWASDKRFAQQPPMQTDGTGAFEGNYNGLDYMLFFNLYNLVSQQYQANLQNQPVLVNDNGNNFVGTLNSPLSWQNPPDLYPFTLTIITPAHAHSDETQFETPEGYIGSPYDIISYDCAPIIVQKLNIQKNVEVTYGGGGRIPFTNSIVSGSLDIQGGQNSYIDLNPTQGNIIIENGTDFDAACTRSCCIASPFYYTYDFNNASITFDRKINPNQDSNNFPPPYVRSNAFDTINAHDGIINYPNPFRKETTFDFTLRKNGIVSIYLTDMGGKTLANLIDNIPFEKGSHVINFDGSALASGSYVAVLVTKDSRKTINILKAR
jgi:hypothetical protein